MSDERCTIKTPHLWLEGGSRAGHETWFRIKELHVALDIGRCPDPVVSMDHVFVTHAHLDHAAGVAWYSAQRKLQQLHTGTVYVPAESKDGFEELLAVQRKLTGSTLPLNIVGLAAGEELQYSRHHRVRAHHAPHRVAARAYELFEMRHHLRPELIGRSGAEIGKLRSEGVQVDEPHSRSLLFYTGDTDRGILEKNEALFRSELLIIECSFVMDGHQDRAATYRHIHIDDIADFAERFENECIVLTHFSLRYSRDEIRKQVRRRLPASLHERVRLALPEAWQRLA